MSTTGVAVGATPPAAEGGRTEPATPPAAGTGPPAERRRRVDPVTCVAAALVLVPTLAAAVSALRNPWSPTNDWALLELQVRAVGTGDTPLVGAWSRFGWDHPGALPLYALALFYRLVPAEHGLLFAAAAVNTLAVAGCAALALGQPRRRALVVLAALAVVLRGLGAGLLSDPWNPTLPILPFALYALLCVEVAGGRRRWAVPAAAGLAAFVVQAHVGFAQPVLFMGAAALAARHWGPGVAPAPTRPWWRAALPTAAVVLVACLPVLVDQVAGSGNLGQIVRWSLGDEVGPGMGVLTEGRLPPARAAGGASWLLDPTGLWAGRSAPDRVFGFLVLGRRPIALLLWLPAAAGVAVALARRCRPADRRAVAGAGAVAAGGVLGTAGDLLTARGAPVVWPFRWVAVVVMLVVVTVGWSAVGAAAARLADREKAGAAGSGTTAGRPARLGRPVAPLVVRGAAALGVAAVAVPVALTVWRGTLGEQPVQQASGPLLRLVPAIEREARRHPLVAANSETLLDDVDLGLPVVLERAGIDWAQAGTDRAEGVPRLQLSRADALDGLPGYLVAQGGAEVVARSGPPRPGEAPGSELVLLRVGPPEG